MEDRSAAENGTPSPGSPTARPLRRTTASVPGKLILMGEHAAVYGYPALVAAIDLRLRAIFEGPLPNSSPNVRLSVPSLGVAEEVPWATLIRYARRARKRWEAWAAQPEGTSFNPAADGPPSLHLLQVALGEAAGFLCEDSGPPISLKVETDLAIGAGFGSSAAAAVSLVAGYLMLRSAPASRTEIEQLAVDVERRQHGLPSGVDTATVLTGGILWIEPEHRRRQPCEVRSPLLDHLRVYQTGPPAESTGEVVSAVRHRIQQDRHAGERLLARIGHATEGLRVELNAQREDPQRVRELFGACQRALEELRVVPRAVRGLVRAIELRGGAAKISGAGALSGSAAGCLLVYHPEPESLAGWPTLDALTHYPVHLGAPGLRVRYEEMHPGSTA
ncbi:MAG: hypothetical protein AAF481_02830 [Acidobacteriota bacterium]